MRLAQSNDPPSSTTTPAPANEEARDEDIKEIVVTAQKRQERLQEVPISISVLSGRQLDSSTAQGLTDALRNVPGVSAMASSQNGGTQVSVRGVTGAPGIGTGSTPVAYYLDGVPFALSRSSFLPDVDIYDLDRVEVLRGPQGTLYGASALNGVVRVLTQEADLDKFEFKARGFLSSTAHGGENHREDLAVNFPILPGALAVRASASRQDLSGWIDRPTRADANDAESTNVRLRVNAQPSENLSVGASFWSSRADYGAASVSPDDRNSGLPDDEPISHEYDIFGLTLGYDFSGFSVNGVTSHIDYSSFNRVQVGAGALRQDIRVDAVITSQEVNLQSTGEGDWNWSLGGIYRDGEDRAFSDIPGLLLSPTDATYHSKSYAVYGELTRFFIDRRLELTAGLRYFKDELTSREDSQPDFSLPIAPPLGVYDTPEFDAVTPRVVLNWHPDEDLTIYGSYSEGFRSGYSQGTSVPPAFSAIQPDRLHNYEVGLKGTFWDGRIDLDTAVYYIDWTEVQQALLVELPGSAPPIYVNAGVNAGAASGMGFELGVTARLTDNLSAGASYARNDLTFETTILSSGVPLFFEGDRLNNSPEYTSAVSVSYDFPIGASGFEGRFGASTSYVSSLTSRGLAGTSVNTTRGEPMLIGRASFAIDAPGGWTATLFADNLTNEEDTFLRTGAGGVNGSRDLRIRPRTVGVQFEYRYGK